MNHNANSKKTARKPWSLTDAMRGRILLLLSKGHSQREVARRTGVASSTVNYIADPETYYARAAAYRERTRKTRLANMKAYYRKHKK